MIPNVKLTTAGAALLAKTPEGYPVPATRWQIGKGALPSGSSLDRTALVDPVEYLELYDVQNQGTESLILGQFTNQGMESGFPFEEVGLLAQDPDGWVPEQYLPELNKLDAVVQVTYNGG